MKKKSLIINLVLIGISTMLLLGCAGKSFNFNDAKNVQIGDPKEVLVQKMGSKPYNITSEQLDGENVVKYIYVSVNGFTGTTKSLSFILKGNKVIQVPHIPDELLE